MLADQFFQLCNIIAVSYSLEAVGFHVALTFEVAVLVPDVGNTAAHTGAEVATGLAEYYHASASHIFTAVVADAFNNGSCATVTHRKTLGHDTAEEGFTTGRTVQVYVTGNDVLFCLEGTVLRRVHNDASTGQALAHEVVAVTFNSDGDAFGQPCTQTLTGGAVEFDVDGAVGQHVFAPAFGHFVGQ